LDLGLTILRGAVESVFDIDLPDDVSASQHEKAYTSPI
jgi:hypothetical protein